jgi:hypothetical protein
MTKPLIFVTTEDGCYIPLSHRLNADGYFRKRWHDGLEMFHRFIWKAKRGDIPEGYEINHLCGCRSCANIEHLECIDGTEHAIKTNKERYLAVQNEARQLWKSSNCSASRLADVYGWRAYTWVRKWKAEENEIN